MKIYLARHGDALPSEVNSENPLSPQGRENIEKIAKFLAKKSFPLSRIFHSEKLRAKQTAEILGDYLAPEAPLDEHRHLNPGDPINAIATRIEGEDEDLMIVGHLPFINKLVGYLIVGNPDQSIINLQTGTVACLESIDGNWIIRWVISLDVV